MVMMIIASVTPSKKTDTCDRFCDNVTFIPVIVTSMVTVEFGFHLTSGWPRLTSCFIQKWPKINSIRQYTKWPKLRLSARFNKGVTEKSIQSQFWLSQSLLIACGSFIANFEPAMKSRIFEIAILKNSTVLYHVKIWWPNGAQWSLNFWYVVCNKHDNKPAKNQTLSRAFPEFMAKKRWRGQPRYDLVQGFTRTY